MPLPSADQIRHALNRNVPAAYTPLIEQMKFFIEPEISCSRFFGMACFTEESIAAYRKLNDADVLELSELGTFISNHLHDGLFIDVPCGRHDLREQNIDFDLLPLVHKLGAREYWEIDASADVLSDRLPDPTAMGIRTEYSMNIVTMQDDLLGCIAKLSDDSRSPKAIYISALQPDADFCKSADAQRDIAVPYLTALYDELVRVSSANDLVILNSSAMFVEGIDESMFPIIHPTLALPSRGFTLMRRCRFDKVHVFTRT